MRQTLHMLRPSENYLGDFCTSESSKNQPFFTLKKADGQALIINHNHKLLRFSQNFENFSEIYLTSKYI